MDASHRHDARTLEDALARLQHAQRRTHDLSLRLVANPRSDEARQAYAQAVLGEREAHERVASLRHRFG